jgi:hypothetical protein
MDTCNATTRERGQLHICNLPLPHPGQDHDSGTFQWKVEKSSYAGETERHV